MISLTADTSHLHTPQDFKSVGDILALIADPAAAKARHEQLMAATAEATKAIAEAHKQHAELDARTKDHVASLQKLSDAHSAKLTAEQTRFDVAAHARRSALDAGEAELKKGQAKLAADEKARAAKLADVERRLGLFRQAAG
jgi:chromosome segregation ATPase